VVAPPRAVGLLQTLGSRGIDDAAGRFLSCLAAQMSDDRFRGDVADSTHSARGMSTAQRFAPTSEDQPDTSLAEADAGHSTVPVNQSRPQESLLDEVLGEELGENSVDTDEMQNSSALDDDVGNAVEFDEASLEAEYEDGDGEDEDPAKDVKEMQQVLVNERCASMDVLANRFDLVFELHGQVQNQEGAIEEFKAEGQSQEATCLQMDVDRVTYLYKSYMRVRLSKIEKFAMHLKGDEEMRSRLHEHEVGYWERYMALWEGHMRSEVLNDLPPQYQGLDNQKKDYDVDMVVRPLQQGHVFFRAQEDVGAVSIGEEETEVYANDILCAPYCSVAQLIRPGPDGVVRGVLL
jgi:GINS complex subunit 4